MAAHARPSRHPALDVAVALARPLVAPLWVAAGWVTDNPDRLALLLVAVLSLATLAGGAR